jgi:hypothetical protein
LVITLVKICIKQDKDIDKDIDKDKEIDIDIKYYFLTKIIFLGYDSCLVIWFGLLA